MASRPLLSVLASGLADRLQRWRLPLARSGGGRRPRVLATAGWVFPSASQGFVYDELTSLADAGVELCVVYGEVDPAVSLAPRWASVWDARRRLDVDDAVAAEAVAHYRQRMPEKVDRLLTLLARATGLDVATVQAHPHVGQAFAFTRVAEAWRPDYLHSYFFYEASLFVFVASMLLDLPRGVSAYTDHALADYPLKMVSWHLRQCRVIVSPSAAVRDELLALAPAVPEDRVLVAPPRGGSNGAAGSATAGRDRGLADRVSRLVASRTARPAAAGAAEAPLVSVVTIFKDAERFLALAVESVLLQSYDRWELLLVDDGSTDGSTALARRFAEEFPGRIRYLEHEGHGWRGMSATRNLGTRHARGELVAFLDADDVWLPEKLERQVALMTAAPDVAMLFGAAEYWHSATGRPEDRLRDHVPPQGVAVDRAYEPRALTTRLYPLGTGTAPCPSDLMVRKAALDRVGGFEEHFQGARQLYEDQGFLSKLYLTGTTFISSERWTRYRIHPESCVATVTASGRYLAVREYFLTWFERQLSSQGIADPDIDRAVRSARDLVRAGIDLPRLDGGTAATPSASGDRPALPERGSLRPGAVDFGALRRVEPVSRQWGFDRGLAVDRFYIERFLETHAADIRGRVLEIEDRMYTTRFGGGRVGVSDVLHVNHDNPKATIVGDLTRADHIPSDTFDCVILTQTLQLIFDTRAALATLHRILAPGGVLLATFPGITRVSGEEWGGSWYWSFTSASARRLFAEPFGAGGATIEAHGNVLAASAFLYGLAVEDLTRAELEHRDPDYEMLITARAVKGAGA
ncbi:MAG: glycosyltransferase [Vicinamibacterales bacterium]